MKSLQHSTAVSVRILLRDVHKEMASIQRELSNRAQGFHVEGERSESVLKARSARLTCLVASIVDIQD